MAFPLRLLWVVALVAAALARPASATDIQGVSFAPRADGPGVLVRIHASGPIERYSVEPERGRLVVTLHGAQAAPRLRQEPAAAPVGSYTIGWGDARVTVELDLTESAEAVAYRDARTNDLLLALTPAPQLARAGGWGGAPAPRAAEGRAAEGRAPETESTRPPVRPSPEPRSRPAPRRTERRPVAPPTTAPAPSGPAASPSPAAPSPSGAAPSGATGTPAPGAQAWRLDTIILDAGHGAHDIGATYHGVREKDVTLAITRRVGRMIEQELPGVRVIYTRTGDQFHELRERGRIANRSGGKLFVSIHANAAANPSARGTETYFLAPHRTPAAAEVMERENGVIALETDPSHYAEFTGQSGVLQAMAMAAYQQESQTLASLVEREFVAVGRHSRGVKQAGFLVLWAASMPSVLVETGFISNPEEGRYLASEAGQDEIARAIFRALATYRDQYERGLHLASAP